LIGLVGLALIVGAVVGHAYGDRKSFQDDARETSAGYSYLLFRFLR